MNRVQKIHNQFKDQTAQQEKARLEGQSFSLPFVDLRQVDLLTPIVLPAKIIAGYTCFNDISDREAQYSDRQFFRGKSMDTSGPCGPWIVTPDELPEFAGGLKITCHWNDTLMQTSNTDQLIFPLDELISYISRTITLMPGDIISTGTPGGVGVFRDPQVFLKPGDSVTVEIEGIGKLSNPVVAWKG